MKRSFCWKARARAALSGIFGVYALGLWRNSIATRSSAGCVLLCLFICVLWARSVINLKIAALSVIESVLAEKRRKKSSKMVWFERCVYVDLKNKFFALQLTLTRSFMGNNQTTPLGCQIDVAICRYSFQPPRCAAHRVPARGNRKGWLNRYASRYFAKQLSFSCDFSNTREQLEVIRFFLLSALLFACRSPVLGVYVQKV